MNFCTMLHIHEGKVPMLLELFVPAGLVISKGVLWTARIAHKLNDTYGNTVTGCVMEL